MPWVRFDDQFDIHRKVDSLSDPAFRLHVSAIFWCARNLTDGYVPEGDLDAAAPRKMKRPGKFVAELVDAGLWLPDERGWQINDYLQYQPSKSKVMRDRKAAAERQRKWREQQHEHRNGVTNGVSHTVSNAAPARPVPTRPGAPTGPYGSLRCSNEYPVQLVAHCTYPVNQKRITTPRAHARPNVKPDVTSGNQP